MPRQNRKQKFRRRSADSRKQIISIFDKAVAAGMSAKQASQEAEAPPSSIYRWKQQLEDLKTQNYMENVYRKVDSSISVLANINGHDRLSGLEAVFTLLIWHRWPNIQENFDYAMMICVVSYFVSSYKVTSVKDLAREHSDFILKYLRLDIISKCSSGTALQLPIFELHNSSEHPYNEMDLAADIAWFFLSYKPKNSNSKSNASLSKAHFASQNGIFRYNSRNAPSSFRKKWHEYGSASPFYYVERHHQGVEFFIDPSNPIFSEEVDELLGDPLRLRTHLGKCRSAVELLRAKLDPRALSAIRFPEFPPDLEPVPVIPPPLPIETNAILEGYTKLQNSFKDNELGDE